MAYFLNMFKNTNKLYADFYDTYFQNIGDEDPLYYLIYNIPNTIDNNKVKKEILNIFLLQKIPNNNEDKLNAIKEFSNNYKKTSNLFENEESNDILSSIFSGCVENFASTLMNKTINASELLNTSQNAVMNSYNTGDINLITFMETISGTSQQINENDVENSDENEELNIEDVE